MWHQWTLLKKVLEARKRKGEREGEREREMDILVKLAIHSG